MAKWTRCSLAGLQNTLILIQFPDFAATQNLKCEVSSFLASYAFPICTNIIYTLVVSQTNNYFHGFVVVGGDVGGSGGGSGPANCCTYFSVIMQQI